MRKSHRWTDREEEIIRTHVKPNMSRSALERVRVTLLGGDDKGITKQRFRFKIYDYLQRGVGWKRKAQRGGPSAPTPKKANASHEEEKTSRRRVKKAKDDDNEKESKEEESEEKETKTPARKGKKRAREEEESDNEIAAKKPRVFPGKNLSYWL